MPKHHPDGAELAPMKKGMIMQNYLLCAIALVSLGTASAAIAKDNSGYVGIDLGAAWANKQHVNGAIDFTDSRVTDIPFSDIGSIKYKTGFDTDLIGGYDFGMFRLEGELGYKHAKMKTPDFATSFVDAVNFRAGTAFTSSDFGIDDKTSAVSAMLNGWLDFGGNGDFGGGAGLGAGYASVHQFGNSHGSFAWQLLAQAYYPVSDAIDVGLKYRYFHAGKEDGIHTFAFNNPAVCAGPDICTGGGALFEDSSRFVSNSLLLSLVYNFAASEAPLPPPMPMPPPPPPAPATQTCSDGSVILATSTCPAPPPPPPPPPTPGERGN